MNVALWIIQIVLAAAFLIAGTTKVLTPKEKLRERMAWVDDFSQTSVRLIGTAEILGALGLILPAATGIAPILTPIAAVGLVIIMIGAAITHVRRKEPAIVPVNIVLLVLAVIVAWGRFGPYQL
ncbi:MAG TPA: DoxX family protein [Lapillicoccus sp.]|uniref:DoxX family protein n=1 Tax=Lapillicoccus sp. TaxID=1909287 RepID=UPI002F92498E